MCLEDLAIGSLLAARPVTHEFTTVDWEQVLDPNPNRFSFTAFLFRTSVFDMVAMSPVNDSTITNEYYQAGSKATFSIFEDGDWVRGPIYFKAAAVATKVLVVENIAPAELRQAVESKARELLGQ